MSILEKRQELYQRFKKAFGSEQKLLAMRIKLLDWAMEKKNKTAGAVVAGGFEALVRDTLI